MTKILIIESDPVYGSLLETAFRNAQYTTSLCRDGAIAAQHLWDHPPDLVVLDWSTAGTLAGETYRQLRLSETSRQLPVILLGASPSEVAITHDSVLVLAAPYSTHELLIGARSLLGRTNPLALGTVLVASEFELDLERHRLRRSGKYIHLGPIEYRLLEYFMTHRGELLTRPQILSGVWGDDAAVDERAVDVQLKRLRAAINAGSKKRDPIRAVRGQGYIFS